MYATYKKDLIPLARRLRKEMTPHERKLWYLFLRNHPARFLRQKPIEGYIVDFLCPKASLVIELDGGGHFTENARAYDEERTLKLQECGLHVIRVNNHDVDASFSTVCQYIDEEVAKRLPNPHGSP